MESPRNPTSLIISHVKDEKWSADISSVTEHMAAESVAITSHGYSTYPREAQLSSHAQSSLTLFFASCHNVRLPIPRYTIQ